MLISSLYASLAAIILVRLSMSVIRLRRQFKVSLGDGNKDELRLAIAAHANASQYMPIGLILLFLLEQNGVNLWLVNALGISFVAGRLFHAYGLPQKNFDLRVKGMQLTILSILAMAALNVGWLVADYLGRL